MPELLNKEISGNHLIIDLIATKQIKSMKSTRRHIYKALQHQQNCLQLLNTSHCNDDVMQK